VDNRVHAADRIYLLCYAVGLGCAAQVTDCDPGGLGCEVGKRRGALGRSCMKHDLMAVIEKRPRRRVRGRVRAPDWYNGFEHDPEEAARVRVRLLRELAANRESLVATHLSFPSVCHVAVAGDVFRWVPGPWEY
jgi:hypothetical protein